jgi:hypothetical protein
MASFVLAPSHGQVHQWLRRPKDLQIVDQADKETFGSHFSLTAGAPVVRQDLSLGGAKQFGICRSGIMRHDKVH